MGAQGMIFISKHKRSADLIQELVAYRSAKEFWL
jgi:hypothetical protein